MRTVFLFDAVLEDEEFEDPEADIMRRFVVFLHLVDEGRASLCYNSRWRIAEEFSNFAH